MPTAIEMLGEKIDNLGKAAVVAQTKAEDLEKKYGKVDFDSITKQIEEASKAATKSLEEANSLKAQIESVDKTAKFVEKVVSRMGNPNSEDDGSMGSELEQKAKDETSRYLRTGAAMSNDVVEAVCKSMVQKSLTGVTEEFKSTETKTLMAGVDPSAGYFIRPERSATMVRRIFESSPVRSVCNIETTTSDVLEFIIDDDEAPSGGWVGEVDSRNSTGTPKIGLLKIPVHEQYAEPKATQKMLDDAGFDIESWLSGKVTRKMTRDENSAFVVGDGSQKPVGFLSLPNWSSPGVYTRGAIEQINSGTSGAITADGIKKLKNSVIEEYQSGAVFATKRENFEDIITLKDAQGVYLLDTRSFKTGDTQVLLGKSVIFMTDIPAVAADALAMVYGDFGVGYTVVDRMGFRVIRDNVTDKRVIKYYTTKRVGGAPTNYESMKILKLAV